MSRFIRSLSSRVWVLVCLFYLGTVVSAATAEIIDFNSDRWVLFNAEIVEHEGQQGLIGSAFLPNIAFTNGVIEFDALVDGSRGYPGITFRAQSQLAYENFYFRPHVPGRPDALQYTPCFNGVAGWQLYNGPGFTAAAPIPTGEWIHVKMEIKGSRARVFFGSAEEPALVIDQLKHPVGPGSIGIRSARSRSAIFANFSVTKTDDLDFGPDPAPVHPRGMIRHWELSQAFRAADVDEETYPGQELLDSLEWSKIVTDPGGLLDIARHRPRQLNGEAEIIYGRVFLDAEEEEIRRFTFGYSDYVHIFLNGRLLFTGNSAYQSRDETFSGVVGLFDTLHLPLQKGRNELLFAVAEVFGGWGLMGQDNSQDFIHPAIQQIWQLDAGNRLPEAVLFDPENNLLYVTQYFTGGNEFISRISLAGEFLDRKWVEGLARPTGLAFHDGFLWAVERRHLTKIDRSTGEIVERFEIPGAVFPNDVSFDASGAAYVTDTRGHRINRFADGTWDVWLEGPEVDQPNGLIVDGDRLLYGNQGDGSLKTVDLQSKEVAILARFGDDANIDGLCPDGQGGYIVSAFAGRVFKVTAEGQVTELLNTTASDTKSADLAFIPDKRLLVIPGLFDNLLTAYRCGDF